MRRAILGFALVAPLAAILLWSRSIPAAIAIVFVSHMLVLYPTLVPSSEWLGPVVTRFRTAEPELWLTIDDGPDPEDTPQILTLLKRFQARATFFVKGESVRRNPELAGKILEDGHSIGNHSHSHPSGSFWCLPSGSIAREIDRCTAAIEEATGARPALFRAPVGMKNPFVHPLLARRGMTLIGWSARGFDGVASDPDVVAKRLESNAKPGAILLLHEGRHDRKGRRVNVLALEAVLERLTARGFRFVIPREDQLGRRKTNR